MKDGLTKKEMAVYIVSHLYKAPIHMIPETHKEVRAYMRLTYEELFIKFEAIAT